MLELGKKESVAEYKKKEKHKGRSNLEAFEIGNDRLFDNLAD